MKNLDDIKEDLINKLNLSENICSEIIEKFKKAAPEIQEGLFNYLKTGEIANKPEIHGFSPRILHERGETITGALLSMDWLIREPKEALPVIKRGRDVMFTQKTFKSGK